MSRTRGRQRERGPLPAALDGPGNPHGKGGCACQDGLRADVDNRRRCWGRVASIRAPRAPPRGPRGDRALGGARAGSFRRDDKGGDEVRKRSWVWRLAAVVAALALALGLAACGDDDDSGDSGDTSGGTPTTLDVAYVTTQQHPYGIAVDAFAKEVNATGALTLNPQPVYPQSEIQLLSDVRSGVVPMATISSGDLGHRRHHRLPGAAGAVPDHQLPPRGRGGRGRGDRHSRCSPTPTSRPATSSPWRSTRAACASRSARQEARERRRLPGHDDPRPAVAGAGRRLPGARRQRRAAAAAGRLPGAPERHG